MKTTEHKPGRIFQAQFDPGDDFFEELNRFVREKNIRAGSVFLLGAFTKIDAISGFKSMSGYDVDRRSFGDWRELVALGNISWPDKPPAALGEGVEWSGPQPYVHIHMALSGGPGKNEEVLVGHLSGGILKGGMVVQIFEHI
ncbi:MAG: DNA-binding protein [Candidatus Tectomicrobia bacterium]|nr:DNA-binding protein [Candidatus Tectomicrobia bacterium]MBI2177167.1 DNA-binding protein [Candidatus Tectomicrobia bacterium]MBI3025201.1 DNA-binding protein [Candidatus Tectomicrobia bacterium]